MHIHREGAAAAVEFLENEYRQLRDGKKYPAFGTAEYHRLMVHMASAALFVEGGEKHRLQTTVLDMSNQMCYENMQRCNDPEYIGVAVRALKERLKKYPSGRPQREIDLGFRQLD